VHFSVVDLDLHSNFTPGAGETIFDRDLALAAKTQARTACVLRCAVLRVCCVCAALRCAVLCCAALCCAALRCAGCLAGGAHARLRAP
jgi:hypothetical protein